MKDVVRRGVGTAALLALLVGSLIIAPSSSALLASGGPGSSLVAASEVPTGSPSVEEETLDVTAAPKDYTSTGAMDDSRVRAQQAEVETVAPERMSGASERTAADPSTALVSLVRKEITTDSVVFGVTFPATAVPTDATFHYRTRTADEWSEWAEFDLAEGPGGVDAVLGSDPVTLSGVDEVEVAVRTPNGSPVEGAVLSVIDPNVPASSEAAATPALAAAPARAALQAMGLNSSGTVYETGFNGLDVHTRRGWGANEALMDWDPEYTTFKGAVIHHTAGTNNYTQDQVPGLLQGIYYYHSVTLGWGDIGYNLLVDRFGGVWEGRSGGLTRAVIGGHAYGANAQTFGISVLGNYSDIAPSAAAQEAVAKAVAWKLKVHGITSINGNIWVPGSTFNGKSVPVVSGHRDIGGTSCPGQAFYDLLPSVRSRISQYLSGTASDASGSANASSPVPVWGARQQIGQGWRGAGRMLAAGAFSAEGNQDALLVDGSGNMWLYPTTDGIHFGVRRLIGWGWNTFDALNSGVDVDGDGTTDIVARDRNGDLWLYSGDGHGGFRGRQLIGWGWGIFSSITVESDAKGGDVFVLAVESATGRLRSYRMDGAAHFTGVSLMGYGWNAMRDLRTVGDVTGDWNVDVIAVDRNGLMWLYEGRGGGELGGRVQIGNGWSSFTPVVTSEAGTGALWTVDAAGALWRYEFKGLC